jgi:heterotetrameric sarcosine oxidase gamma subunit
MSGPDRQTPDPLEPGHHGPACDTPLCIARPTADCVQLLARHGPPPSISGLTLPPPGHAATTHDLTALATGPGAWLLLSPTPGLAARMAGLITTASLIDQSHGRALFTLSGPAARDVLSRLCRIDLHPRVFPPGRVAATPLAGLPAILHHADTGYTMILPATYARSFAGLLAEAAIPFGFDVP